MYNSWRHTHNSQLLGTVSRTPSRKRMERAILFLRALASFQSTAAYLLDCARETTHTQQLLKPLPYSYNTPELRPVTRFIIFCSYLRL